MMGMDARPSRQGRGVSGQDGRAVGEDRHGGRRLAIHALSWTGTPSGGWRAFVRHDDGRLAASAKRFAHSATNTNPACREH